MHSLSFTVTSFKSADVADQVSLVSLEMVHFCHWIVNYIGPFVDGSQLNDKFVQYLEEKLLLSLEDLLMDDLLLVRRMNRSGVRQMSADILYLKYQLGSELGLKPSFCRFFC
jgi:hypothetical protein